MPDAPADGDFAEGQALRDEIWTPLRALTRTQRAVMVLRYYEDLDDRQIGAVLRCSPSTVRVHAARALGSADDPAEPGAGPEVCRGDHLPGLTLAR
ncbi:sigma factor-like helix-turn-helix DNA-binding protein [Actinoplanes flavus]|uniref:sigma factor-like helix-turn-helix DNA-binding protein n=1 Tax=Actinoplanes flavus TaxID=2820290 RepID=UPI0027DB77F7|nr:sigma factor-like helix-turn-helix DNA-binding protein [Actinoplanes flavus]